MTLEESGMKDRIDRLKAADAWKSVVGPDISAHTMRPYVKGSLMTVRTPDAPLRQELTMNRSALVKAINGIVGREIITDIRFTS